MLRFGTVLLMTAAVLSGCAIDVEGIKKGAEELKKDVESSNLKDCKDEDGHPCRNGFVARIPTRRRTTTEMKLTHASVGNGCSPWR